VQRAESHGTVRRSQASLFQACGASINVSEGERTPRDVALEALRLGAPLGK
jgi:hypothetical protein